MLLNAGWTIAALDRRVEQVQSVQTHLQLSLQTRSTDGNLNFFYHGTYSVLRTRYSTSLTTPNHHDEPSREAYYLYTTTEGTRRSTFPMLLITCILRGLIQVRGALQST